MSNEAANSKGLVSLVLAVRNERGGLAAALQELDQLTDYRFELIFVEGGSTDGTYEELMRLSALPHRHKIIVLKQDGKGKKDAVVKGIGNASGELTFVFDDDGEIATSDLPRFIKTLQTDKNLFLNGDRFLLPMVKQMKFISRLGNKIFSILMTVATGRYLHDPLCGIKGTRTEHYRRMITTGTFDNDLDRFAELDQLFGAQRLGLTIKELPVVYHNRRYGESKVHHFSVGWLFLRRIGLEFLYWLGFSHKPVPDRREKEKSIATPRTWRLEYVLFAVALLIVAGLSFRNLLTYPRIWQDESSTIEQAHNVLRYGSPDIEVAPGKLTGVPYLIQSTGYPVEVTLAMVFGVFGYGFSQARIFMLVWTLLALFLTFYFARRFFGSWQAILAFFLIASFSSFYNSGRTVVGEIPGFVFLLIGLACLMKDNYFATGLFFGLAIVTKLSVFSLIVPTIVIVLMIHRTGFLKKLVTITLGMIPAAVLWFVIVNKGVVTVGIVREMLLAYSNPFGSSQLSNVLNNIANFFHSPTLICFTVLFFIILCARLLNGKSRVVVLYDVVLVYSVLAFFYYLRSPGWLRFILIAELLILFLLPHSMYSLAGRFLGRFRLGPVNWRIISASAIVILVCIQLFRFSTSANIFYSDAAIKTADYLNSAFPDKSVAVVNNLPLAVLLHQPRIYKVVTTGNVVISIVPGKAYVDSKPLSVQPPVDLFIIPSDRTVDKEDEAVLSSTYKRLVEMNGYVIYNHI